MLGWVTPPDLKLCLNKAGMELIDRRGEDSFFVAGGPVERIQRHTAVNPAGGIAGEYGIRQRWQQVSGHSAN